MEVEGRKDDKLRRKREEESRKRGMVGEERKAINIKESGLESTKKFETCLEIHRKLEEKQTKSPFIMGEGAMQLSSGWGFVENGYIDGTNFGENMVFNVAKAANCNELVE